MRGRIPSLEAARGLAAVAVVAFHVRLFHGLDGVPQSDAFAFTGYGWLGVQLFFVLSGLVLYLPYARGQQLELADYLTARFLRIVPALWVALAVGSVALGLHTSAALRHALFVNPVSDKGLSPVPPAWTLTVEMSFYLVLPALVWLFARYRAARVPVLVCMIATGFVARQADVVGTLPRTPLDWVDNFAFGILAAIVVARVGRLPRGWLVPGLVAFVAALAYVAADPPWVRRIGVAGALFAVALCAVAAVGPRVPRGLVWLGTISYGVYLWHWIVLVVLTERGLYRLPDAVEIAAVVGFSVLLGWASWRLVERPALGLRRRARKLGPFDVASRTGAAAVVVSVDSDQVAMRVSSRP